MLIIFQMQKNSLFWIVQGRNGRIAERGKIVWREMQVKVDDRYKLSNSNKNIQSPNLMNLSRGLILPKNGFN